jgi:hyperosmotically inducible protein
MLKKLLAFVIVFTSLVLSSGIVSEAAATRILENRQTPSAGSPNSTRTQVLLAREIGHELAMLPDYDVFDWLDGQVLPDGTVQLRGQVVRTTTKTDAEQRVRDIEGVKRVDNQIEVLPVSPVDDRLRIAIYRAIFNFDSPLFRYATRSVPPIHIIVKNGRATLKGVVANQTDSQLAYTYARQVTGLFDVTDELRVENARAR